MIRIKKAYSDRPLRINFLDPDSGAKIKEKIKNAYDEGTDHRARSDFYRGDHLDQDSVLCTLFKIYHYKCAFCEANLRFCESALAVEHYRPRKAFLPSTNTNPAAIHDPAVHHPGYPWLTYEWSNLLLACTTCNGSKSHRFPIAGQRAPRPLPPAGTGFSNDDLEKFRADQPDYVNERPLLINPESEDPTLFFQFDDEGQILPQNERARVTVAFCKLNRRLLQVERRAIFDRVILKLKEATVHYLLFIKFGRKHAKKQRTTALELAFQPIFSELATFGESDQSFSAFHARVKERFMARLEIECPPQTVKIVGDAWTRFHDNKTSNR